MPFLSPDEQRRVEAEARKQTVASVRHELYDALGIFKPEPAKWELTADDREFLAARQISPA